MGERETAGFADDTIGRRIAYARKLRGLTQQQLADRVPCSKSLISQVEGGHKPATRSLTGAVARALHVEVTELTGQPYRGRTAATDRIHATIPDIREALVYWDVTPGRDVPPRPLDELRREVDRCTRLRQGARYVELGTALPSLIKELITHVHTMGGEDRSTAFHLLTTAYSAADSMAYKLGYLDLFHIAVERLAWAAGHTDDPLLPHVARMRRSMAFVASGAYDGGLRLLDDVRAALESDRSDSPTLSVRGTVHLRAAVLAAQTNRATLAWDHMSAAHELATRVRVDTKDYDLLFGPTNAAIHDVAVAVELGDADEAIRRGAGLRLPASLAAERSSHHYIDLSRAWLWAGRWDQALQSLLTAERLAAQRTRYHPMARETVTRLLDVRRRLSPQLRLLARRMGGFAA
ncbi:hypothetical protein Sru01_27160 [Sphaerisporangium rufum]|uniref:HTH cro/C1-type domain-containing protein n=1 Tax=Sphaerisporangium rufum TaxID=1381558 RepID=A0A919R155_9ACTN|nr:helix-turn-helix transcriptional regulator [Sphaerisporangium rufum]GII77734.1 hypothetical protein Sru01_27160 [Sphaerisporangium rufum]